MLSLRCSRGQRSWEISVEPVLGSPRLVMSTQTFLRPYWNFKRKRKETQKKSALPSYLLFITRVYAFVINRVLIVCTVSFFIWHSTNVCYYWRTTNGSFVVCRCQSNINCQIKRQLFRLIDVSFKLACVDGFVLVSNCIRTQRNVVLFVEVS